MRQFPVPGPRFPAVVLLALASLLFLSGCQNLTPEQQAKAKAAAETKAAALAALTAQEQTIKEWVAEYNTIKAMVDAGKSVPAALVLRYAELEKLLAKGLAELPRLKAAYDAAAKADEEARLAGVAWYNRVPWGAVGKTVASLLLGAAAVYFPAYKPLLAAGQAVIRGVSANAAANPDNAQALKDAVLAQARGLGIEAKLDALVQRFDPPVVPGVPSVPSVPAQN